MTWPRNTNARGLAGVRAKRETNNTAIIPLSAPECGKWAAVRLYCFGLVPLENVARMFRGHPEWRAT